MPLICTFKLNNKETSFFQCPGVGALAAFSGTGAGRDNPSDVAKENLGPLPPGVYYIVDRQSGGRAGPIKDYFRKNWYHTDRSQWFMLWRANSGDTTMIDGIKRGAFRLHPMGPMGLSEGCITIFNPYQFNKLAAYLRKRGATLPVPGTTLKAYGIVNVQ